MASSKTLLHIAHYTSLSHSYPQYVAFISHIYDVCMNLKKSIVHDNQKVLEVCGTCRIIVSAFFPVYHALYPNKSPVTDKKRFPPDSNFLFPLLPEQTNDTLVAPSTSDLYYSSSLRPFCGFRLFLRPGNSVVEATRSVESTTDIHREVGRPSHLTQESLHRHAPPGLAAAHQTPLHVHGAESARRFRIPPPGATAVGVPP